MKFGIILSSGALFLGLAGLAQAQPLTSPDSDTLNTAYQLIQFDIQECNAIQPRANITNGHDVVPVSVLQAADKICTDARGYLPVLQKLASDHDFTLPTGLTYTLTARYAALVRDTGVHHGIKFLNDQISSHEDALAVFQEEVATGTDPQVKAAAADVIPVVQENLNLLRKTLVTQ